MKVFLCVALFVAAASADSEYDMPELFGTFNLMGVHDVNSFYTMPRTVSAAKKEGWVIPEETKDDAYFTSYFPENDPRIGMAYDPMESSAGYWICAPPEIQDAVSDLNGFDYTKKGMHPKTLFGQKRLCNFILFVDPAQIAEAEQKAAAKKQESQGFGSKLAKLLSYMDLRRLFSKKGDNDIDAPAYGGRPFNNQTGEGLWVELAEGYVKIPYLESDITKSTKFVKQNCFVKMGQHYFYDVRDDLSTEDFQPFFILYNQKGQLHGLGYVILGNTESQEGKRKWMEDVNKPAIQMIAPGVPGWVLKAIDDKKMLAHHIYFQPEPWKFQCTKATDTKIDNY